MTQNVPAYSATYAKVKALSRGLLDKDDYKELLSKKSVGEVAAYLKSYTAYRESMHDIKETTVHRGELEEVIKASNTTDFIHFSHFLYGDKKKFLSIYAVRFEIDTIKLMMRIINSDGILSETVNVPAYYQKLLRIDVKRLMETNTINDFIRGLEGSPYYELLRPFINSKQQNNMFNLESALDIYYYKYAYKCIQKYLNKTDAALVMQTFGAEVDLNNILWIYRCKNYYHASNELIYAYLIPIRYKLSKSETIKLVEAANPQELYRLLTETKYSDIFEKSDMVFHEHHVSQYLFHLNELQYYSKPFTIAEITSYLYIKQAEINNLIKIIEGIRYKLDMDEIYRYLIKSKGGLFIGY